MASGCWSRLLRTMARRRLWPPSCRECAVWSGALPGTSKSCRYAAYWQERSRCRGARGGRTRVSRNHEGGGKAERIPDRVNECDRPRQSAPDTAASMRPWAQSNKRRITIAGPALVRGRCLETNSNASQIRSMRGENDLVLRRASALRGQMKSMPDPPGENDTIVNVWNVREMLLGTGRGGGTSTRRMAAGARFHRREFG